MSMRCRPHLLSGILASLLGACSSPPATVHDAGAIDPVDARPPADAWVIEASLSLSELQAHNESTLLDEDGDSSDWIEVHNHGDQAIDLSGWHLTDKRSDSTRWTFPALSLEADGYLVVFASGKDRRQATGELHTNFELSRSGEYLALVAPNGVTFDEYRFPRQPVDASYGRIAVTDPEPGAPATEECFFDQPTPGAVNGDDPFHMVADPELSTGRGFYQQPTSLALTSATEGATIRYTTDGSVPDDDHGTVYTEPLLLDRTTVVRAIATLEGYRPSAVVSASYLFLDDIVRQDYQSALTAGLPDIWGVVGPDYGMDPDVIGQDGQDRYDGLYADTIRDDLLALPTLSISLPADDMFGSDGIYSNSREEGIDWERAASVELIHPDGEQGFQIDCGIRIQGGAFRRHSLTKKHSFRLLFKNIYGAGKLEYPLFGQDATTRFDTLTLRAGSNDSWQWAAALGQALYVRDSFARRTLRDLGGRAVSDRFVHLYINGFYWGIYDAIERPDHSFSASYHGGDKEHWDAIHDGESVNGDFEPWTSMVLLAQQGLDDLVRYLQIQGLAPDGSPHPDHPRYLDIDDLVDYMLVQLYVGNLDWPHKNYWLTRDRTEASTGFKMHLWDVERALGLKSPIDTDQTGVGTYVATPYRHLRESPEFRLRFADRAHRAMSPGGALYVDDDAPDWNPAEPERNRPAARLAALATGLESAIVAESARWGDQHVPHNPYTRDLHWAVERDVVLQDYLPRRTAIVRQQLIDADLYPAVPAPWLSLPGGPLGDDEPLSVHALAGTIYYTLDGRDPRLLGGEVDALATAMPAPGGLIAEFSSNVTTPVVVSARVRDGNGVWSPLHRATFVHHSQLALRVSELMYHPSVPDLPSAFSREDFEFLELANVGAREIELSSYRLRGAVEFDFASSSRDRLASGERVVVVASRAAFAERHPDLPASAIVGEYSGRLGNGGDDVVLEGPLGQAVLDFAYRDDWQPLTDGAGYSLCITDLFAPVADWSDSDAWTSCAELHGSPGR